MIIAAQVLDSSYGQAAAGIYGRLERADGGGWTVIAEGGADSEGRIESWTESLLDRGLYRVVLDSDNYFASLGASTAYPEVIIVFRLRNGFERCQLQVTLSPFSHSAYIGSARAGLP